MPTRRARRWCTYVAAYALVALAFPSLGPLPWLIPWTAPHAHAGAAPHDAQSAHRDVSMVPGSPTHPDDHDCAECKVLKHLARCLPATAAPALAPSFAANTVAIHRSIALPTALDVARTPPARAPPLARA